MQIKREKLKYLFLSFVGGVAFLVLWQIIYSLNLVQPFFLPSPKSVFDSILTLLIKGSLLSDVGASLFRIITGFLAGPYVDRNSRRKTIFGLEITVVTNAKSKEQGLELYKLLGFPIKENK